MAEIVRMPKLSDTMTEGVVAKWYKKVGDKVSEGDLLADIETDKATMEFESFVEGTLLHIGVPEGGTSPVDTVLAIFGEKGEDFSALLKEEPVEEKKEEPKKEEAAKPAVVETKAVVAKTAEPFKSSPIVTSSANGRIMISPLAKKLAADKNINISMVNGTGDGGRIVKRDIENYGGGSVANFVGVEKFTEVPVSQMRKVIASRLGESKFSAPHFYLTIDIDMDNAIAARKSINDVITPNKVSFNDLIIKAVAAALKENPAVNSSWLGDRIRYNEHVNIGVAVAVEDGLLVPVVRFADGKTLSQISGEVKEYAQRARDKKLQPEDWEGSTFTISNLGMFGIEEFTAIINPPDACILAIGGTKQVPVVKNGVVVPGNVMKVTLSCDHRVVDGVAGSKFLQMFKNLMENPVVLLGAQNI
jgi:pyruvate dehydrogenase E2 component (dihydrolipoamide acetyltransferase)